MSIPDLLALFAAFAVGLMVFRAFRRGGARHATRDMVARQVRSSWPSEADLVLSELDLYSGPESSRVQMDIILLSKGSLEDLRRWIKMANNGYREVISAAEYSHTEIGTETLREFREWKPPENQKEVSFKDILS